MIEAMIAIRRIFADSYTRNNVYCIDQCLGLGSSSPVEVPKLLEYVMTNNTSAIKLCTSEGLRPHDFRTISC